MTICHLIPSNREELIKKKITSLERQLDQSGFSFTILSMVPPSKLSITLIKNISKQIRSTNSDCLHVHNLELLPTGGMAAVLSRRPCVMTLHEAPGRRISSGWFNLCREVVCSSEYIKSKLLENHKLGAGKLRVIPEGIDIQSYQDAPYSRDDFQLKDDHLVLASIGNFKREEDPTTLLKALRKLVQKKAKAELLMVGDGPMRDEIKQRIDAYGLKDHVHLVNGKTDLDRLWPLVDVFCTAAFGQSKEEDILQAMSHGIPAIAPKTYNHPELIEDGKTGVLVPCGYPERIETALMRLSMKREVKDEMGRAARIRVEEKYTLADTARAYERLYAAYRR